MGAYRFGEQLDQKLIGIRKVASVDKNVCMKHLQLKSLRIEYFLKLRHFTVKLRLHLLQDVKHSFDCNPVLGVTNFVQKPEERVNKCKLDIEEQHTKRTGRKSPLFYDAR